MILAALSACGYHMAGSETLPGNVRTIGIKVLTNKSMETGAEAIITNALCDELNQRRPGTIKRVTHADAVLSGTIDAINCEMVSRSGTLKTLQRSVTVDVSLALKDRNGKTLWSRSRLRAKKNYTVSYETFDLDNDNTTDNSIDKENAVATESNRNKAIEEAALRLAEDVYRALTDNF